VATLHNMNLRMTATSPWPAAVLVVSLLLAACTPSVSGSAMPAAPAPTTSALSSGSAAPTAGASSAATPSATPSAGSSAGSTFHVELVVETGRPVTIDVKDESGRLLKAASGTPGDGASVAQGKLVVASAAPSTLRLTWAGPPCANADLLVIDAAGSQFILVQPACGGDAIAFDRVLLLTFSDPLSAADVDARFQTAIDTPG